MNEQITQIVIAGHSIGIIDLPDIIEEVKQLNIDNDEEIKQKLLERIKVKNYVSDSMNNEYKRVLFREYKKSLGVVVEEEKLTAVSIRILGPGCSACEKMEQDVKLNLVELNIAANVEHIRDVNRIAEYGMVQTPALVINGEIALSGRSLPRNQLKKLLQEKIK
jgi:small redox-active disulfide protein 2